MLPRTLSPEISEILKLARTDKIQALARMATFSTEEQIALVCDAPLNRRVELLELSPAPEILIPQLPNAELCFIVKELGLADASWLLAHATQEQILSAVDLDVWSEYSFEPKALEPWLASLAEAGTETLLRAARAIDPEMLVLFLRSRIGVELKPNDDDWQPPAGSETLENQFYFWALHEKDDLSSIKPLLHSLFQEEYWTYFRTMQGVIHELPTETEEWALRWRTGRLQDLGFVPREEAIRVYAYLPPEMRAAETQGVDPLEVGHWTLPIWQPKISEEDSAKYPILSTAAKLGEEERLGFFYAFLGLANRISIADHLPLSEADTIPKALNKAAQISSQGIEWLAEQRGAALVDLLRETSLEHLFRIGVSLERDASTGNGVDLTS